MILAGMLLGTIGIDVNTSAGALHLRRPDFGDGIDFAVIAMGMFGIGETIANLERKEDGAHLSRPRRRPDADARRS